MFMVLGYFEVDEGRMTPAEVLNWVPWKRKHSLAQEKYLADRRPEEEGWRDWPVAKSIQTSQTWPQQAYLGMRIRDSLGYWYEIVAIDYGQGTVYIAPIGGSCSLF